MNQDPPLSRDFGVIRLDHPSISSLFPRTPSRATPLMAQGAPTPHFHSALPAHEQLSLSVIIFWSCAHLAYTFSKPLGKVFGLCVPRTSLRDPYACPICLPAGLGVPRLDRASIISRPPGACQGLSHRKSLQFSDDRMNTFNSHFLDA